MSLKNCIFFDTEMSKNLKKSKIYFILKDLIFNVSFPIQDLIGVKIQHFLYRSWADLYNFPVQK